MPIVAWGDEYLLGIREFDDHHRQLVDLLNRTYDEYTRDPAGGELEDIIKELDEYASYHFTAEEQWMAEHAYPDLARHKGEHATFTGKIFSFRNDLSAGKATSSSVFIFLAEWLTDHILETDTDYKRFMGDRHRS